MGTLEAATLIFVGWRLAIMVDIRTYLLIKNGARNNGAGFLLGRFFNSNTRTFKVHKGVPYPQGKIKRCFEKTWI